MSASTGQVATDHVAAMFAAIQQGDMDALKACFTPGGVVWHNDDELEVGIDEVCANLGQLCAASGGITYEDQRTVRAGNLCFVQHVLTAQLHSGDSLRVPALMRVETDSEGLVARIDEYYDSRTTDCLKP